MELAAAVTQEGRKEWINALECLRSLERSVTTPALFSASYGLQSSKGLSIKGGDRGIRRLSGLYLFFLPGASRLQGREFYPQSSGPSNSVFINILR